MELLWSRWDLSRLNFKSSVAGMMLSFAAVSPAENKSRPAVCRGAFDYAEICLPECDVCIPYNSVYKSSRFTG